MGQKKMGSEGMNNVTPAQIGVLGTHQSEKAAEEAFSSSDLVRRSSHVFPDRKDKAFVKVDTVGIHSRVSVARGVQWLPH